MKKLRPQVSADLVEQIKGEFESFEDGLLELINMSEHYRSMKKIISEKVADISSSEVLIRNENASLKKESKELAISLSGLGKLQEKYDSLLDRHGILSRKYTALTEKHYDLSYEHEKLKVKLKDCDELLEKYNREVHQREMLELKYRQLEHDAKVENAAEFSGAIAILLGLDKEMLDKSQSMTIRTENGQIYVDIDGHMPLTKVIY